MPSKFVVSPFILADCSNHKAVVEKESIAIFAASVHASELSSPGNSYCNVYYEDPDWA